MAGPVHNGPVLEVDGLSVGFADGRRIVPAVHDVGFVLHPGETLALVGESGSGKSVTSLAAMRLLPPAPRTRVTGSALLRCRDGETRDLLACPTPRCGACAATRSP